MTASNEWVHPEHREIHEWLIEWGRWLKQGGAPNGHCASIEHRYKSPQCWDERNPRPPEPDIARALLIEGLMRIVPRVSRKLLKLRYMMGGEEVWISRRLRLKGDWVQHLYTARQIVLNLTRHQLAPTLHGRFSQFRLSDALVEVAA